ncbi:hypothetical protein ACFUIZ_32125 [Streptomyces cinereoruber]|uniref:hypothetical protein n=1 Tax=Streptomyces cinereoruber TaxID=67260 RepID=UPI0036325B8C
MRAVVRRAVRDVRIAPTLLAAEPPTDPTFAALRTAVDDLTATVHALGELMLDIALAYLSDPADVLAPLCEATGKDLEAGLAARRYALSGDRRDLSYL